MNDRHMIRRNDAEYSLQQQSFGLYNGALLFLSVHYWLICRLQSYTESTTTGIVRHLTMECGYLIHLYNDVEVEEDNSRNSAHHISRDDITGKCYDMYLY